MLSHFGRMVLRRTGHAVYEAEYNVARYWQEGSHWEYSPQVERRRLKGKTGVSGIMTRVERVFTVLEGSRPDRVPNMPLISFATARLVGISAGEYYRSTDAMAKSILAGLETYGYDGVTVGGDLTVEAQALGMKAEFPKDQAPQVHPPIVETAEDLATLSVPNPKSAGRMPVFIEAIKTIRKKTGGEVFIKSTTASPFVLAGHLLGIENLMLLTVTEGDFLNDVLAFCAKVVLAYAVVQCEAGAHAVGFGAALASPDLLSPVDYTELVQPHEQKIIDTIHEMGCKHVVHICGNSLPIIGNMAEAGSDIIDLDQNVDILKAKEAMGDRSTIRGNLDPIGVMVNGTPDQVLEASRECIEKAKPGGRFILAPGCTVAYNTPPANIHALQRAVEEFGAY